ncbi:MAG TPA: transporter substrate-binding domain-containing protein [Candidatus Obscuribacterales bacterium]
MRFSILSFGMVLGVHLLASPVVVSADLATIQRRGYLIVAVKDNRRPLGFIDAEGNLTGFEIAIATRLAETLFGDATAIELRPVANRDRLTAVLNDEVDLAIAGIAITPMRERLVSFSLPYYLDGTAFITRDPAIQRLDDLSQEAIALLQGSEAIAHVQYTLPLATLRGVASYEGAYAALETGSAIAFAGDVTALVGWAQEDPAYRLLPDLLTAEPLAVTLPKGNQYNSLRQFVNTAINQWHTDGWLEDQATQWGLP